MPGINDRDIQTQAGLTAGSYTNASFTVNAEGILTAASSGPGVFVSPVSGYQALLLVGPGYQLAPGSAAFGSAPLLSDKSSGDSTSGYKGIAIAAAKPASPTFQSGSAIAGSIIAAWPFYENTGTTVHDIAGNALNLSFGGSGQTWAAGPNGTVLTTNGSGSVNIADTTLLKPANAWTISAYINASASQASGNSRWFRKASSAGVYLQIAASTAGAAFTTTAGYTIPGTVSSYESGYHLYTFTYNGSAFIYYVDGTQVSSTAASGPMNWDTASFNLMGSSAGDYAVGSIDVAYYWNRALAASEIGSLAVNPYQLVGTTSAGNAITALLDIGTLGSLPISTIRMTRTWSQQLSEVLEYSSNGASWMAIPTGYTPGNNAGTAASLQTTVALGTAINARYLRYSGKDSGTGAQLLLTDFGIS